MPAKDKKTRGSSTSKADKAGKGKPTKLSKNQKRRLAKKLKKQEQAVQAQLEAQKQLAAIQEGLKKVDKIDSDPKSSSASSNSSDDMDIKVEYVTAPVNLEKQAPEFDQFKDVFKAFGALEEEKPSEVDESKKDKGEDDDSDLDASDSDDDSDDESKISNKKKKLMTRMTVGELKQKVKKPELVQSWDTTAADPLLLLHLKGYRNAVPVPEHWDSKSKYLSRKRGFEKIPFQLPEFIAATGIGEMREALFEKEGEQSTRQKQRDRVRPKMNKMNIDYQVLHDAFFRYQTKPKMTVHGDIYYEGKELEETEYKAKPGVISQALKEALGMPNGAPPPWLVNQQRYGPPPSYPHLKIPGLTAPLPPGASWGHHAGGWGKIPLDEMGNPLYGNVYEQEEELVDQDEVDKSHWGEMEEEEWEESEDEYEEEDEDDEDEVDDEDADASGMQTATSIATAATGMETEVGTFDLRKDTSGIETPGDRPLFQVLEQKETKISGGLMGSQHGYVIPSGDTTTTTSSSGSSRKRVDHLRNKASDGVEIALDEQDLANLDADTLKQKYEDAMKDRSNPKGYEDLSDMVKDHVVGDKRKGDFKGGQDKKRRR